MIRNPIHDVVRYLQSKHIKITEQNEWLAGCCDWYTSNNPQCNQEEMQDFVYEQWLLADLRDIGEGCLPANIGNIPKTTINGKMVLQVDSFLDVAESCYSQLLKIRNVSTANVDATETKPQDWEPKKKRMLKLTCTDGLQMIYGMEYKLIPSLREPFVPGLKVLIIGPVECRRGVLLLEQHNIQVLAGEVDSILVKNALENVLARALNVPENPNPFNPTQLQNGMANMNVDDDEEDNIAQPTFQGGGSENLGEFSDNDDDLFLSEHLTQVENRFMGGTPQSNNSNAPATTNNVNHGSSTQHETNSFPLSTGSFQSCSSRGTNSSASTSSRPTILENNSILNGKKVGIAHPILSSDTFSSKRPAPSPTQPDMKMARIIRNDAHETRPRNFQTFNENIGVSSGSANSVSGKLKIRDLKNFVDNGIRKCDASFLQITSKPKIREEKWQLSGEINDETGSLNVAFSDPFLEKMYEFSAVEILSQKERMKSNPDIKGRIDTILRRGVQKITSLKGEFHIEFSSGANLPKVIDVIE